VSDAHDYIQAMAKHLPPSAASLRLLDVGGAAGEVLSGLRGDLEIIPATSSLDNRPSDSLDAVVAYDLALSQEFLGVALSALRPGGRLVVANPTDAVHERWVALLENAGYTRILVESVFDGVLIRGEKPHAELSTQARIQQVAARDASHLDLAAYSGRYLYLLIRQTPNKPAWRHASGEPIEWQAVALENGGAPVLLAFSSLPQAVAFMQPAVMAGHIKDVNKVAKFRRETAHQWTLPLLLNPTVDMLDNGTVTLMPVDPQTAESPDE
jgi:hypothetical protein